MTDFALAAQGVSVFQKRCDRCCVVGVDDGQHVRGLADSRDGREQKDGCFQRAKEQSSAR